MANDNNSNLTTSEDVSHVLSETAINEKRAENVTLTAVDKIQKSVVKKHIGSQQDKFTNLNDIQEYYSENDNVDVSQNKNKFSTAESSNNDEGFTTNVEKPQGLQTSSFDKKKQGLVTSLNDNLNSTDNKTKQNKLSTRIKRKRAQKKSTINAQDSQSKKNSKDNLNTNKIQTNVEKSNVKLQKGSEKFSEGAKGLKTANRVEKKIIRKGQSLQTSKDGSDSGENLSNEAKETTKTAGTVVYKTTDTVVKKTTGESIKQIINKVIKKIVEEVKKVFEELMENVGEAVGGGVAAGGLVLIIVIVVVIVVILLFCIICLVYSETAAFGAWSSTEELQHYATYIEEYEDENASCEWAIPLALIEYLDYNGDINWDEGEQYLLNTFSEEGLITSSTSTSSYYNYLIDNEDILKTYYETVGVDYPYSTSEEYQDAIKEAIEYAKEQQDRSDEYLELVYNLIDSASATTSYLASQYSLSGTTFIYPIQDDYTITGDFPNYSDGSYHGGVDFSCSTGTPVYAVADGVVSISTALTNSDGSYRSYGEYIAINHGDSVVTYYGHLSKRLVSVNDEVKQGDLIGYVGSTGNASGPHLHFEVRVDGSRVNPWLYLP